MSLANLYVVRKVFALVLCIGTLAAPGAAFADPDFGPGNSSKGPHDPGAKSECK